jgi:hypothetical protein
VPSSLTCLVPETSRVACRLSKYEYRMAFFCKNDSERLSCSALIIAFSTPYSKIPYLPD